jgi:hypothetical protein
MEGREEDVRGEEERHLEMMEVVLRRGIMMRV